MPEIRLAELRAELSGTYHDARVRRMVELGRLALKDAGVRELLGVLSRGDAYERRLALYAQFSLRDGRQVLAATTDASASVRCLSFQLVPRVCDDVQALEALKMAYAIRRDGVILRALARHGRRAVIDVYLDWFATRESVPEFADIVPLATPAGLRRHLPRALARPSACFWSRLARHSPEVLAEVLADHVRAVEGTPDAVTRLNLQSFLPGLVRQAPDAALVLFELLLSRGLLPEAAAWRALAVRRPNAAVSLLQRHVSTPITDGQFARAASRLSDDALAWLVRRAPASLGDIQKLLRRLSVRARSVVVEAWCDAVDVAPAWGTELLRFVSNDSERTRVHARWSAAVRDDEGVIGSFALRTLPLDVREWEARRHLRDVTVLAHRAHWRLSYASLLPWDEAAAAVTEYLGHPDRELRGTALSALLAIPGLRPDEPALVDRALALVLSRKHEQDPVRQMMLRALVEWPRRVWRREHTPAVDRILRDALDAADLSEHTSRFLVTLVQRIFARDPAWGATCLAMFPGGWGLMSEHRLGTHLTEDEVRASAPWLLEVARNQARFEHGRPLFDLVRSLGARVHRVPGLPELFAAIRDASPVSSQALAMTQWQSQHDRAGFESSVGATVRRFLDQGWFAELITLVGSEAQGRPLHTELVFGLERVARRLGKETGDALGLLHQRASSRFAALLPELLAADASVLCFSVVNEYLYRRRQDLLTPYLDAPVISGRFVEREGGWLMAFVAQGFHRWTPEQSVLYARSVRRLMEQPDLSPWTLRWCVSTLAALDWAPKEALLALVDDARPVVREKAIRVLSRCDQGEGLPTLLRCLEDERVRIAVYCLRRACNRMLPERVLALLSRVPLTRVTVAKEVVRLLGELRSDAAYARLIALDGTPLHRDVRIALLRALWDHLEREPTWALFARVVEGQEWVMAARLGDIPANRLTDAQDRRLSALLARVLSRPEPEARISLIQHARLLRLKDAEGTFLAACGARLGSSYDDEAKAAIWALLSRGTERDLARLEGLLAPLAADPRNLHVVLSQVVVSVEARSVPNFVRVARAAERVLSRDGRFAALRVRCAATALSWLEWAATLVQMGEAGHLHADALAACRDVVSTLPDSDLEAVEARLTASRSEEARRVAVWCLARDARPNRGWTPERLVRLVRFQQDASPLVAGAALAIRPPREAVARAAKALAQHG